MGTGRMLQIAAQALLNNARSDFGFEEGGLPMFVMDVPDLPPQHPQVMLVQVSGSATGKAEFDRVIGVCNLVENPASPPVPGGASAYNFVAPIKDLKQHFRLAEQTPLDGTSSVEVLEGPKHGTLTDLGTSVTGTVTGVVRDTGERMYRYLPAEGYVGKDRTVLLVEIAAMKIKLVYSFQIVTVVNQDSEHLCPAIPYKRIALGSDTHHWN